MAKLAPSPAPPIDLVPTETRRESTIMPNPAPVPQSGPTINRDQERAQLLANLDQTPPTLRTQPGAPHLTDSARPAQSPNLISSRAPAPSEAITQPQEHPNTSGAVTDQPKRSSLLSAESPPDLNKGEQAEEKHGLLGRILKQLSTLGDRFSISELAAKVTGLMNATIPKLGAWARPTPKHIGRESLNIKPPPESSLRGSGRAPQRPELWRL